MINRILGDLALIFGGIAIGCFLSEIINSEKFKKIENRCKRWERKRLNIL